VYVRKQINIAHRSIRGFVFPNLHAQVAGLRAEELLIELNIRMHRNPRKRELCRHVSAALDRRYWFRVCMRGV